VQVPQPTGAILLRQQRKPRCSLVRGRRRGCLLAIRQRGAAVVEVTVDCDAAGLRLLAVHLVGGVAETFLGERRPQHGGLDALVQHLPWRFGPALVRNLATEASPAVALYPPQLFGEGLSLSAD